MYDPRESVSRMSMMLLSFQGSQGRQTQRVTIGSSQTDTDLFAEFGSPTSPIVAALTVSPSR